MPWTAAACSRTARMNEKSIARVAGPAPCAARFRPNSINFSRVMSLTGDVFELHAPEGCLERF